METEYKFVDKTRVKALQVYYNTCMFPSWSHKLSMQCDYRVPHILEALQKVNISCIENAHSYGQQCICHAHVLCK